MYMSYIHTIDSMHSDWFLVSDKYYRISEEKREGEKGRRERKMNNKL